VKYLLLFLVFVVVAWRWRAARTPAARKEPKPRPPDTAPSAMVACAHCGVHLPTAEATPGHQGTYCSVAHRQLRES
jgi:uncharacterized protein